MHVGQWPLLSASFSVHGPILSRTNASGKLLFCHFLFYCFVPAKYDWELKHDEGGIVHVPIHAAGRIYLCASCCRKVLDQQIYKNFKK